MRIVRMVRMVRIWWELDNGVLCHRSHGRTTHILIRRRQTHLNNYQSIRIHRAKCEPFALVCYDTSLSRIKKRAVYLRLMKSTLMVLPTSWSTYLPDYAKGIQDIMMIIVVDAEWRRCQELRIMVDRIESNRIDHSIELWLCGWFPPCSWGCQRPLNVRTALYSCMYVFLIPNEWMYPWMYPWMYERILYCYQSLLGRAHTAWS